MPQYYGGRKTIQKKTELWKAIQVLLKELTGENIPVKEIRSTYDKWLGSSFVSTMPYGEFVMKLYWTPLKYD